MLFVGYDIIQTCYLFDYLIIFDIHTRCYQFQLDFFNLTEEN